MRALASGVPITLPELFAPHPTKPPQTGLDLASDVWIATWEILGGNPKERIHRTWSPVKAREWGTAWAKERRKKGLNADWEVVQKSWSLYSKSSEFVDRHGEVIEQDFDQPTPSSERQIVAVLDRVRKMLAELAGHAPYGEIKEYQLGIEWVTWVAMEGMDPYPLEGRWWGGGLKTDPMNALEDMESNLREIMTNGVAAASMERYQHTGRMSVEWIEVPRLTVKWACSVCSPGAKIENEQTVALIGKQAKRKREKRKREPKKEDPKAAAAREHKRAKRLRRKGKKRHAKRQTRKAKGKSKKGRRR